MYYYNVVFYIAPEGYPHEQHYIDCDAISCDLKDMFKALDCGDITEWSKKSMKWIEEMASIAYLNLQTCPSTYKQYEAEYGWDIDSVMKFLDWVLENAVEYPYAKIKVEYC